MKTIRADLGQKNEENRSKVRISNIGVEPKQPNIDDRIDIMNIINYWVSTIIVFLLTAGIFPDNGKKILNFFPTDSSASIVTAAYTPPIIPESLEQEKMAVLARVNELAQALEAKNIEKAIGLIIDKEEYQQAFQQAPDKMPILGRTIKSAQLSRVGPYNKFGVRLGELALEIASKTYTISIVKISGKWLFKDL